MCARKSAVAAAGLVLAMLPGVAAAQGLPPDFVPLMELATDSADVSGSALGTTVVNSPFTPVTAGLSYEVDPDTCGLSPWSRVNAEAMTVDVGPIDGDIRFATGITGLDYACTNVGGNGLDVAGGVYAGGTTGVVSSPAYPTVTFDIEQWLVGAYGSFSKNNFSGNLKVQYSEEDYVGHGFNLVSPEVGAMVPEGSSVSLSRLSVSGAASYAYEALDNTFLIPIVGFDVAQLSPEAIPFGGGFAFVPQTSTSALVYGGLTLARTIVLPNGTSAIAPFVSGTYFADVGNGIKGSVDGPGGFSMPIPGDTDLSYAEVGAGFNYLSILDDGSGKRGVKQLTFGLRGFYKWNEFMRGWGGAGTMRLQF